MNDISHGPVDMVGEPLNVGDSVIVPVFSRGRIPKQICVATVSKIYPPDKQITNFLSTLAPKHMCTIRYASGQTVYYRDCRSVIKATHCKGYSE